MQPSLRNALLSGFLFAATALPQVSPAAEFHGLGALPATTEGSVGSDISGDGLVVVGGSPSSATVAQAWRWTLAGGMQGLGFLPGETTSSASSITSDAEFIAGTSGSDAFRWSSGGGFVGIDDGFPNTGVTAISDDGDTIVGGGHNGIFTVPGFMTAAWRWRSGVGIDLSLPGDLIDNVSFIDVADDGQVILANANKPDDSDPFLRTDTGSTFLGFQSPILCQCGDPSSAMTPDAAVVVGTFQGKEAYRWRADLGSEQLLGILASGGALATSHAEAVSADGSVVVGNVAGGLLTEPVAFIWTQQSGMRDLRQTLVSLGLDLTGWQLTSAVALSTDGTTILGNGINPSGTPEAWVAFLEEIPPLMQLPTLGPSATALLVVLVVLSGGLAGKRRRPLS